MNKDEQLKNTVEDIKWLIDEIEKLKWAVSEIVEILNKARVCTETGQLKELTDFVVNELGDE